MNRGESWVDIVGVCSLAILTLVVVGLLVLAFLSDIPIVRCA